MTKKQNLEEKMDTVAALAGYWLGIMRARAGSSGQGAGLISLLEHFSDFAREYIAVLKRAPVPSQQFVVNNGVERLLHNFNTLSRACEQRQGPDTANSLAYFISEAERVLEGFCKQWQTGNDPLYVKLETPVVYFEKTYGISRALYKPEIPVISIPLTEYNVPARWMALAHETGHHIFWNSLGALDAVEKLHFAMLDAISRRLRRSSGGVTPWNHWLEEIFADVCAARLAGPQYLISTRNFAAERVKRMEDLAKNDGEHPCPYLRPLIVQEVLRKTAVSNAAMGLFLDNASRQWDDFCAGANSLRCANTGRGGLSLGTLRKEAADVVSAILDAPIWEGSQALSAVLRPFDIPQQYPATDPLPTLSKSPSNVTGPNPDTDVPRTMKEIWDFLQNKISITGAANRAAASWNALVNLSIADQHGHGEAGAHDDPQQHWWAFWAGVHRHDTSTGEVI